MLECIAEQGFQRATASEITRRAGVTWGAVQHHFGGKDGLFEAVLREAKSTCLNKGYEDHINAMTG